MNQNWITKLTVLSVLFSWTSSFSLFQHEAASYGAFNPEENLGVNIFLTEGDILVNREDVQITYIQTYGQPQRSRLKSEPPQSRQKRSADSDYYKTWYNRSVPYILDQSLSADNQALVSAAIAQIENVSCILFRRRTNEKDYIRFTVPNSGCYSPVGRMGGQQDLGLGDGCFSLGTIQHEILHALGMWHEQSRRDRDEFIEVMWENIPREHHGNFNKRSWSQGDDIPYDYGSIMHYSNNTFAIDRQKPTLKAKKDLQSGVVMGQRVGLSEGDINKLNHLYRCAIKNCSEPDSLTNGQVIGTDFKVGAKIRYYCNAGYTLVGASERECINLGNWSGQSPTCIATNQGSLLHYCNFDDSSVRMCGWTQATDEELDWDPMTGPTKSENTGPNWDHTLSTETGGYVYVEASNTRPRQKARLVSPRFALGSPRACLVMYTFMYGQSMGNLTVYMNTTGSYNSADGNLLISLKGDQGQLWKQIFLVLYTDGRPFTVILFSSI